MSTSLTLQALLKSVIARAGLGAPGAGARDRPVARRARALPRRPPRTRQAPPARPGTAGTTMVVVVATDADVDETVGDIRFFLARAGGAVRVGGPQDAVLPFPSHEVDPYRGLAPHLGVLSARAKALHAAATGRARVIVASATALLPRVSRRRAGCSPRPSSSTSGATSIPTTSRRCSSTRASRARTRWTRTASSASAAA